MVVWMSTSENKKRGCLGGVAKLEGEVQGVREMRQFASEVRIPHVAASPADHCTVVRSVAYSMRKCELDPL